MEINYSEIEKAIKARAEKVLQKNLEKARSDEGAHLYGSYCSAVLSMPDYMVTKEDIRKANEDVITVSNYMTEYPSDTQGGRGEIDFVAIRLAPLLYDKLGRVEAKTFAALERFYLNDDFASVHNSENHMLIFRASRYLAACRFAGKHFNQYGMSADDIRRIDHDYLISYIQYRARRGWAEFNSMGYEVENIYTFINLYDCAPDEDIRRLSSMIMDTMFLTMFENTTENAIYGGAHGRAYAAVVTGLNYGIYENNKFYFGCGDFYSTDFHAAPSREPHVYLSSWRPDKTLYEIYASKHTLYPFTAYEKTHNHTLDFEPEELGFINKYTYCTPLYAIGSVNHQDDYPDNHKYKWYKGHQQTNFSLAFAAHPKAAITVHHPGKTGLHNYWHGDQNCGCNHLFGNKNTVIGIFYIPYQNDEHYGFIHANVPKAYYDEVIEDKENNRLFIKIGDAYACLTFSESYDWGGENPREASEEALKHEISIYDLDKNGNKKTEDIRIAFACQAGDKENDGDFEAFVSSVKAKEFKFDKENLTLTFGNMHYVLTPNKDNKQKADFEGQYIDGELINSDYEYTYNSPIMKARFDSGVIDVFVGGKLRTMDFMNITDKVK